MFFLGILSIFQIFFIPGIILIKQIGFKTRLITKLISIITSSLTINYCLVLCLTTFHLYKRSILMIIVCCEIAILIWQNWNELNRPIEFWLFELRKKLSKKIGEWKNSLEVNKESSSLVFFIRIIYICACLILAYISLNWIWKLFLWNIGSVFNSYDTIMSWNSWAIAWSNNVIPGGTAHYPQLLSTNWSIIYILIGSNSIQFFAQAIMPLFTLFIIIMIIDLGFAKKNLGFLLGSAITYLTLKKFLGSFLIEGLADLPCAFFAFSAIYLLFIFQIDEQPISQKTKYGYFITASVAGCAITKQVGLLFLFLFLFIFIHFYIKPILKTDKELGKKVIIVCLLILILITVLWYLYKQILIWQGLEKSEVMGIIDATQNAFGFADIKLQLDEIIGSLGKYFYLILLLIPMSFFVEPLLKSINLFLIFPLFFSWALFASYDFRNLAIVLPLFGISSGLSLQIIIDKIFGLLKKINKITIPSNYLIILLMIILGFIGAFIFPDSYLKSKQTELTMNTFSPVINQKVVSAVSNDDGNFVIITNYPIKSLPGMEGKSVITLFNNYDDFRLTMQSINESNVYLLVPKYSNQEIMNKISEKLNSGDYLLLFEDASWIPYLFIKVIHNTWNDI